MHIYEYLMYSFRRNNLPQRLPRVIKKRSTIKKQQIIKLLAPKIHNYFPFFFFSCQILNVQKIVVKYQFGKFVEMLLIRHFQNLRILTKNK